jgi:hypothetical protein
MHVSMVKPPAALPVAVREGRDLKALFGIVREVWSPGLRPGTAWVAHSPLVGDQLWVDSRLCAADRYTLAWHAAFGRDVPSGYTLRPLIHMQDELVVVAIIAVLIGLLVPAVPKTRDAGSASAVPFRFETYDAVRIPVNALWH